MAELQNTPLPAERARLPALPAAELSVDFLARLKEIIETMQGQRGTGWDRAVTLRDLQTMGLAAFTGGSLGAETGGLQVAAPQIPVTTQLDQLDALIRETRAYKALMTRIGSAESYEGLPDEVRAQLEPALLEEARRRGAALRDIELKIQNESRSLAYRMTEITAALNESAAGVRTFNSAYADDLTAMATRIEQLSAQVGEGGGSAEIEERLDVIASAIDGLKAQYTLKVQTNPTNGQPPVIAGIALAAESPIEGPGTSELIFMAEMFRFLTNNGSKQLVRIEGDEIVFNGAVTARNLRVGSPDNIVPDPAFNDLAWWGRDTSGNEVKQYGGVASYWRNGSALYMGVGGPAFKDTFTPMFPLTPGATYIVEYQSFLSGDFQGQVGIYLHIPQVDWYRMGAEPVPGWTFAETGLLAQFASVSAKGTRDMRATFTVPFVGGDGKTVPNTAQIRITSYITGGYMEAGSFSITRVADGSLVGDGVLEARHIIGDTLDVLAAKLGKAQIGAGGALWQGQEFYDTGLGFYLGADASGNAVFSMATANGGKLLFNPAAGVFKLVNPTIDAPVISTQYSVSIPTIDKESQANSTSTYVNYGTLSVTKNNGVGPYEYLWSIGVENGDVIMSGDPSGPSVVIKGRGSNVYSIAWVTVQVRDVGTGISMQASGAVRYQHGTGIIP